MKIDKDKLIEVIEKNFKDMQEDTACYGDKFCVGECDGLQVHIIITRDDEEKFEVMNKDEFCITE